MWTIADAERKLDRIFTLAMRKGPQRITDGERTVVLISRAEYERLKAGSEQPPAREGD
jgi:prevent-host-death family protein